MYKLDIDLGYKQYDILVMKGLFNSFGKLIKEMYLNKKIIILTDSNIENIYGEALRNNLADENINTETIVIPPGEKSKSIEFLEQVYEGLTRLKISRDDILITFGGGVVGDLGGFVASTYLRGIKFIQIPTTLLSQIDSSIGGKVAINLSSGKNLIGSFYHPELVLIDPELLKTLDSRFMYDGMAEVIKYGCIKDESLFFKLLEYKSLEAMYKDIEEVIFTCCNIKKHFVESDEKDVGTRMLLNFGHTIGHGIEKYYNYERYTHGEAVAIGMYNITKKSEELGITEKGTSKWLMSILKQYKLPYELPVINKNKILDTIFLDKKSSSDNIKIVLLKGIGESLIKEINKDKIKEYI